MLISVGWLPPYLYPSGAFLGLGTSVCFRLLTLTRVTPKPGLRLFPWPEAVWVDKRFIMESNVANQVFCPGGCFIKRWL
jgi:hypothetical protein